jgi:hypothetical protein
MECYGFGGDKGMKLTLSLLQPDIFLVHGCSVNNKAPK